MLEPIRLREGLQCVKEREKLRRILIKVAYDGTGFHGWQLQPGSELESVEGNLNAALSRLFPAEQPVVTGASRTDSGVHALGNAAVFDLENHIPAERIPAAMNTFLPSEIRVLAACEVASSFHPRFTPHRKVYEYRVDTAPVFNPLRRLYAIHFPYRLNVSEMKRAASALTGVHDFCSFVNPDSQVLLHGGDAVREIYELSVWEEGTEVVIHVEGNGFLYHMIRILAGTLLDVGRGKKRAEDIPAILEAHDRTKAGPTLPAKGLCLVRLEYPQM